MKKIAINLFLASPRSISGAFVSIEKMLPALFATDEDSTYYLVGHAETIDYFRAAFGERPNVRYRICDIRRDVFVNPVRALCKLLARIKKNAEWRERIIAGELQTFFDREHIETYFSPSGAIYPRGLHDIRHVTTILDLQPEYFPENFSATNLEERRRNTAYAVEHSENLIAISQYTKKSLEEKYGADPEKIAVTHFACNEIPNGGAMRNVPRDFLLYPAAVWPHKNHAVLIRALAVLKDHFPELHVLCTGAIKRPNLRKELERMAFNEGLAGRVQFFGYLPENNLRDLYAKALVLVFPSAFEGFGIPLVEAFQYGVPVIAADNSSIIEIVSDAGILVPTGDAEALARAIERVLTDPPLREELIRKGHERAKLFSWEKTARETANVLTK